MSLQIKDDPSYHWVIYDSEGFISGSRWEKWSQREFFKDITKKGNEFEYFILSEMSMRSGSAYNKLGELISDLDQRRLLSQVQFCLPGLTPPCFNKGQYFVADQMWIKYNEFGDIQDMIIIDSKLSKQTNFTPGQTDAKNSVGGELNYKSAIALNIDEMGFPLPNSINQGQAIKIIAFLKVFGDGNGNFVGIE